MLRQIYLPISLFYIARQDNSFKLYVFVWASERAQDFIIRERIEFFYVKYLVNFDLIFWCTL